MSVLQPDNLLIYQGFDQAELDREYSPSSAAGGDIRPYLRRYASLSQVAADAAGFLPALAYGPHPDEVVDVLRPENSGSAPLHVFIHGGYWQALGQRDFAFIGPAFQRRGVAFASLNYTLAPAASIGEMIGQCRRALAWLWRNAAGLGVDPARLTISGHSAGAHLCAMLLATDWPALGLPLDIIKSALLISGIYDLEPIRLSYVDGPLRLTPEDVAAWSPMLLDLPFRGPVAVVWGEHDTAEFRRQSRSFAEKLAKSGCETRLEEFPGRNHFDILFDFIADDSRLMALAGAAGPWPIT
jgi:arylformamidase